MQPTFGTQNMPCSCLIVLRDRDLRTARLRRTGVFRARLAARLRRTVVFARLADLRVAVLRLLATDRLLVLDTVLRTLGLEAAVRLALRAGRDRDLLLAALRIAGLRVLLLDRRALDLIVRLAAGFRATVRLRLIERRRTVVLALGRPRDFAPRTIEGAMGAQTIPISFTIFRDLLLDTERAARLRRDVEVAARLRRDVEVAARLRRDVEVAARLRREVKVAAGLRRDTEPAARLLPRRVVLGRPIVVMSR